jgi:hypothetical protein
MNQPENPVPARGARPQLFRAPSNSKPNHNARGHTDFGPSILATIDGGQARFAGPRDRSPVKRVLLMALLVLLAAVVYLGVKLNASRAAAMPATVVAAVPSPVEARPVEPVASAVPQAMKEGAAAIETVAAASAINAPVNVVASVNNIQSALDSSEPAPPKREPIGKSAPSARTAPAPAAATKPVAKTSPQADTDAELLAAMLPHLKRSAALPTSPAYEKRCGSLAGDAATDCRAKFCNGRQGADAACPTAAGPRP